MSKPLKKPKSVLVKLITTWSPSALKDYEKCPRKLMLERSWQLCSHCFAGSYVGKPPLCNKCGAPKPPKGEPLVRGDIIHSAAEKYIRALRKDIAPELREPKVKARLVQLRNGYKARKVRTELELAFDRNWNLTEYFGKDVFCRFKIDVMEILSKTMTRVSDWKTGRPKEHEYDDQLQSYCVGALSAGFGQETEAELIFTDHNLIVKREDAGHLKIADLPKLQKRLSARARKLLIDEDFLPRAQDECRFCPFSANKGGPCEF